MSIPSHLAALVFDVLAPDAQPWLKHGTRTVVSHVPRLLGVHYRRNKVYIHL